jgi:hypothetical protein
MWELQLPAWELVVRATAIYLAVLVALRLFGKREVGQFTLIDLVRRAPRSGQGRGPQAAARANRATDLDPTPRG